MRYKIYGKLDSSKKEVFNAADKASISKFINDKEFNLQEYSNS